MFLSRFFVHRDVRSIRHPLPRRRPLVEALEGRQLLSTFTVSNFNDVSPGSLVSGNHVGTNLVSGNHIGSNEVVGNHIGTNMIQGNHIGTNMIQGNHIG
jgi:hypothetical protein